MITRVLAAVIALFFLFQAEIAARLGPLGQLAGRLTPSVPYGYALAAGAILAMPYSWLMPPGFQGA